MIVLGIESSCDETSVAIMNSDREVLSHIVFSQVQEHKAFGGVVPEIGARCHFNKLSSIFEDCCDQAGITPNQIDVVAATAGPGLIGGVLVGTMFAKGLALGLGARYIAVNHLEGHILSNFLENDIEFPFLQLLVSGGHCLIIRADALGEYKILATTIDDAPGEAFDKVARMLGFSYPGGRHIENSAKNGDENAFLFPVPLAKNKSNPNFSFSGLKTSVRNAIGKIGNPTEKQKSDISASFQKAATEALLSKLSIVLEKCDTKRVSVAGGVAANSYLRKKIIELCEKNDCKVFFPAPKYCTDNAAMIAITGLMRAEKGLFDDLDFSPRSRWPVEELRGENDSC